MKLKIPNKEILILFIAFLGIFSYVVAEYGLTLKSVPQPHQVENEIAAYNTYEAPAETLAFDKAIYFLHECGGKIGIYDATSNVIIDIVDIFVSTLPKKDRIALKEGIEIYSFKELSEILNDFST